MSRFMYFIRFRVRADLRLALTLIMIGDGYDY